MRLWMLTKPEFPAIAQRAERLYAEWDRVDPLEFERPYRWMIRQMAERGLDTRGNPPFWAWHSNGAPGRRIDLRVFRPIEPTLRLTLDVPDELALLNDYETWHHVLNNSPIACSESEGELLEAKEDAGQLTQLERESNWSLIFDMSQWGDPEWNGIAEERTIQVCLPWFEHRWIRKIEAFDRPRTRKPRTS